MQLAQPGSPARSSIDSGRDYGVFMLRGQVYSLREMHLSKVHWALTAVFMIQRKPAS